MALGQNMPEIIKEKRLIENLDDNSKKCLKTLSEVLEAQQNKQLEGGQQPDFKFNDSSNPIEGEFGVPALGGIGGWTPENSENNAYLRGSGSFFASSPADESQPFSNRNIF